MNDSTYNQYTSTLRRRLDDDELDEWELEVYFEAYYPVQEGLHSVQHMIRLARMGAEDGAQNSGLAWVKDKSKLWEGQPWKRLNIGNCRHANTTSRENKEILKNDRR